MTSERVLMSHPVRMCVFWTFSFLPLWDELLSSSQFVSLFHVLLQRVANKLLDVCCDAECVTAALFIQSLGDKTTVLRSQLGDAVTLTVRICFLNGSNRTNINTLAAPEVLLHFSQDALHCYLCSRTNATAAAHQQTIGAAVNHT